MSWRGILILTFKHLFYFFSLQNLLPEIVTFPNTIRCSIPKSMLLDLSSDHGQTCTMVITKILTMVSYHGQTKVNHGQPWLTLKSYGTMLNTSRGKVVGC